MKKKLMLKALVSYLCGGAMVAALLFVPAGTFRYPGGWRLIALLFAPMLALGVVLFLRAPELLEKRLNRREGESVQKKVIGASAVMFLVGFIAAGLDFRLRLTAVPVWICTAACIVFLLSYGLYAEVMRENAFLSRTVEVQEGQKVVDTGLYGIVRHPMYAASILMFMSMPLVLGSWIAFVVFLIYPLLMIQRVRNEEAVLKAGLSGYEEYMHKVCWRLFPFIW